VTRRVAALVVALLVAAVGCFGGTAAAAAADAPYADPAAVCEGESQQLVALLGNGETATGNLSVFVGTELRFAFCSAEGGESHPAPTDAWDIESVDGLDRLGNDSRTVTVEAVGPADGVDLAQHVDGRDADKTAAPTLTVVATGSTDTSYLGDPSELRFSDGETREAFVDARETYVSAVGDAESLTTALAGAADASDPAGALENASVESVDDRAGAVENASAPVERVFVAAAADGDEGATAAYLAQRAHSAAAAAELQAAADDYVAAVESQATDARLFATAVLFGPFVAGALVGAFAGRAVSRRDLKQVRRQRRRDRTVEYSLGTLWKVFVGAAVAVLAGVAVVVVGAGVGDVLAVIA